MALATILWSSRGNAECLFFTGADSSPGGSALGVGFDQLLVVEPPYDPELVFTIAFSMLMAVKWRSAATAALLCPFCAPERADQ